MNELQIDPKEVDAIVLSHIHGDHVGGLSGFLEQNSAVTVYPPGSFPKSFKDQVRSLGAKVEEVHEAKELLTGVHTTGELGSVIKEQSLVITTSKGLVIITGCAYPGVVNIIRVAKDIVLDSRVYLVIAASTYLGHPLHKLNLSLTVLSSWVWKGWLPAIAVEMKLAGYLRNDMGKTISRAGWAREYRFHSL